MVRHAIAILGAMIISIGLAAGMVAFVVNEAHGATDQNPPIRTDWQPCAQEDSLNCVWDARHRGNGEGHSFFTSRKGRVWKIPHHIAHSLVTGDMRRDYQACPSEVSSDPVKCIWEERVWLNRSGDDTLIPASIGRYLLHG